MSNEDHQAVAFLKDGGDADFEQAMKGLQDFSTDIIEKKNPQKMDYEASNVIKGLDQYYEKKMNFEKNDLINPPPELMNKLDSLYGKIMESKQDKNMQVKTNKEYLGDPKVSSKGKLQTTMSYRQSIDPKKSFDSFVKDPKRGSTDGRYYELETFESQPNFDKSLYEYPVMSTPSIKGSFAGQNQNQYQYEPPRFVPGIPVYYMPNNNSGNIPMGQAPRNYYNQQQNTNAAPFFGQSNYNPASYNGQSQYYSNKPGDNPLNYRKY